MKKFLFLMIACALFSQAHAQINDHALGIRFGFGGGISYQHKLSKTNRLELDGAFNVSESYNSIRLTGIYQWVFDMNKGFSFYAGPAISTGSMTLGGTYNGKGKNGFYLSGGGMAGLDYNFDGLPVQVSVDVLPMFPIINNVDNFYLDPALGVRIVF